MEFNREYYITGEKNMRKPAKTKGATRTEMVMLVQKVMNAGVRLTQMVHRNCTMNTMN